MEWKPIPEYGDLMTIQEFRANVECGGFIDDDGSGHYALTDKMADNASVHCDVDFIDEVITEGVFTHVVWFNK